MHFPQNFANKSGFPYLVDIKLTGYCPFEGGSGICKNCYQSSTKYGKHADQYFVSSVLPELLFKAGVLEVNFGGGEPTLYKGEGYGTLLYTLQCFKSKKFKVGITTKNYNWYKDESFQKCLENIDSVAISVNSLEELERARPLAEKISTNNSVQSTQVYYQCVFELVDYEEFKKFIEEIAKQYNSNITLLGYKEFGFGKNGQKFNYPDEWIEFVKDISARRRANIGIDSVIVANWRDKLIQNGVKEYYLVGTEGKSTCYIDAVKKKMYSSSFSYEDGFDLMENKWIPVSRGKFLENFGKF